MGDRPRFGGLPLNDAEAALAAEVDSAFLGDVADAAPRMLEGDRALFSRLYIQHKASLSYLCRRYLNDPRDVEEVVQETFLKLFLALPDLDSEAAVVAWSRRTATNLCIDRYRADKRRPAMAELETLPEEYGAECDEDQLVLAEDAAIVRAALADLPELYRRALIAREVEELPLDVIAAELEVEPAQMKHLLHRARRAMRRSLESRTGRAVAGLLAALLAIASMATGVRFVGGTSRNAAHIDANPLVDGRVDSIPRVGRPPVAKPPAVKVPVVKAQPTKPAVVTPRKPAAVQHHAAHKPVAQVAKPAVPAAKPPVVTPPVTPPVAAPPVNRPPTYSIPAGPAFQVEGGVTQSGDAYVVDRGTTTSPTGTAARSTFSATTGNGALVIEQAVTQHESPVVWLDSVSLGGIELPLGQVLIERHVQADGSVALTIFASVDGAVSTSPQATAPLGLTSSSFAVPAGSAPSSSDLAVGQAPTALTISLVLAPGGSQVLYEHVAVAQA